MSQPYRLDITAAQGPVGLAIALLRCEHGAARLMPECWLLCPECGATKHADTPWRRLAAVEALPTTFKAWAANYTPPGETRGGT